jgi:hypothetical protein
VWSGLVQEAAEERARQAQTLTGSDMKPGDDFSWAADAKNAYTKPPGTGPFGVGPPAVRRLSLGSVARLCLRSLCTAAMRVPLVHSDDDASQRLHAVASCVY